MWFSTSGSGGWVLQNICSCGPGRYVCSESFWVHLCFPENKSWMGGLKESKRKPPLLLLVCFQSPQGRSKDYSEEILWILWFFGCGVRYDHDPSTDQMGQASLPQWCDRCLGSGLWSLSHSNMLHREWCGPRLCGKLLWVSSLRAVLALLDQAYILQAGGNAM